MERSCRMIGTTAPFDSTSSRSLHDERNGLAPVAHEFKGPRATLHSALWRRDVQRQRNRLLSELVQGLFGGPHGAHLVARGHVLGRARAVVEPSEPRQVAGDGARGVELETEVAVGVAETQRLDRK